MAAVQMFNFSITMIMDDWEQVCKNLYVGKFYIHTYTLYRIYCL